MSYNTGPIRNLRTVKAIRGESLTIDLGQTFVGGMQAWMKKDPNDLTYREFNIIGNRYLQLTKIKASDYYDTQSGDLLEAVKGRWYFDVELIEDAGFPELVKTIYRGTINFANDITGSQGIEINDPNLGFNTFIGLSDTPNTWGEPGQMLVVNAAKTDLIWINIPLAVITEDITASVDVGGILIGDDVLTDDTLTEFVKQLIAPLVLPTIKTNKSVSGSGISTQSLEIGSTFIDQFNYSFSKGLIESKNGAADTELVGNETTHLYSGNGISAVGAINTPVLAGSNQWGVIVDHDEGITPYYDSDGNLATNLDALRVAGSLGTNSNVVTGKYRYWFDTGPEGTTPIDSVGVRALIQGGLVGNITFDINIPAGEKEVAIYIPDTMTLVSVLYVESSNADVTGTFNETNFDVNDGGGSPIGYSNHKATIGGVGYPSDATYSVTINL